jgi:hypothetical protein
MQNNIAIDNMYFDCFTEDKYKTFLQMAKNRWLMIEIGDHKKDADLCFWRHDIDLSLHRASRLALIEAEQNVSATYFLYLHSPFYNLLEKESIKLVYKIIELGHHIGLHFDLKFGEKYNIKQLNSINSVIMHEKNCLSAMFDTAIECISFHNPIKDDFIENNDIICGMTNIYGPYFKNNFTYISDSNGYWREQSLGHFLENNESTKIHVLTHPGWWTPNPVSPDERIKRCLNGRMKNVYKQYLTTLKRHNRKNIV